MEQQKRSIAQQNVEFPIIERKCRKCLKTKSINDYHKAKSSRSGFKIICKDCRNKSRRKTDRFFAADNLPVGKIYCHCCATVKDANEDNFYKSKIKENSKVLTCI